MITFQELVMEKLTELNISKYKLAKLTKIHEQTIYSFLRVNSQSPRLDVVLKIAKVLDIDLNKLKGEN